MSKPQFESPPYSGSPLDKKAFERKRELPPELLKDLIEIEFALLNDPFQTDHPERISSISRDGKNFVYVHPDPEVHITFEVDEKEKVLYFCHYAAPAFAVPKTIFISYAHEDKDVLKQVKKVLSDLEDEGKIKYWDDSMLTAGESWETQIEKALESAKAGLLLVSPDFLKSQFIKTKELPTLLKGAREKGKKIFWIHLSPSDVFKKHKEITKFQSPMDNPKVTLEEMDSAQRKKTWKKIKKALRKAINTT